MGSWNFGVSLLISKNGYKNSLFSSLMVAADFWWEEEYLYKNSLFSSIIFTPTSFSSYN